MCVYVYGSTKLIKYQKMYPIKSEHTSPFKNSIEHIKSKS